MSSTEGMGVQRFDALRRANEIRSANALVRQHAKGLSKMEGSVFVAGLLEDPTETVLSMPVGRLLLSVRRVGVKRVHSWLSLVGVRSLDRHVGDLSVRQREALADELRGAS